ncbi:MAG: hypothetical protein AAF497_23115 [Planctomycetota bacterium]
MKRWRALNHRRDNRLTFGKSVLSALSASWWLTQVDRLAVSALAAVLRLVHGYATGYATRYATGASARRLIGLLLAIALSGVAVAQAPDEPAKDPAEVKSTVTDTGVETIYVRDADGELVPVLNMSYEDFLRLYNLDRQLTQPEKPPSFSVEELLVTGAEVANRAELEIKLRIKLLTDEMVRIPLRLKGAVLNGPAVYEGKGEHTIQSAEAKSGGYVSWLRGDPLETHTLKFKVLTQIFEVGQQSRLELTLPRAASSRLEFVAGVPSLCS